MRFEAQLIDWLQEATTAVVAEQMWLSWDEVDGIMQRAVPRGLDIRTPRGAGSRAPSAWTSRRFRSATST